MRLPRSTSLRLVLTALLLAACASSGGPPPPAPPAGSNAPPPSDGQARGMCMYDRVSGHPRICLQFSFGRCMGFGDRCEVPSGDGTGAASPAPQPASR